MALYQSGSGLGALVGVGTTNPTSNLQVYGTPIAAGNVFSVLNTAASGNVAQFSSSAGTALIINASGNVGIGKTNPGTLLDVNGAFTATSVACSSVTAQGPAAADGAVYLSGRAIEIGQGQTSDTASLIDFHSAEGTYSDFAFRIIRNGGANGTAVWINRGSGNSYFQNQDSGDFYFQSGGVSILGIVASGAIYFGKSNYTATTGTRPGTNFVISYDCSTPSAPTASATYYAHNVGFSGGYMSGRMWNNSGAPSFYAGDTFLQATGCYDGTNNGTGASSQFAGNLYLDGGLSWCLGGSGTTNQCYAGAIYFRTGLSGGGLTTGTPTNRMVIMPNTGYVGIGTNSPGYPLDVTGDMHCSGAIYCGNNSSATAAGSIGGRMYFGGTYGDGNFTDGGQILSRLYATTESSELVIFKGNDVSGSSGPDRIRLRAGAICFDTYPAASSDPAAENIRMTIDGSGNVGIGTATPNAPLNVWGSGPYSGLTANPQPGQLILNTTTGSERLILGAWYTGGTGSICSIQASDFYNAVDHGQGLVLNPLGGTVGIGTAGAGAKLDVWTGTARSGTAPASYGAIYATADGGGGNTYPPIAEFRHSNQTQGIGINFNSIFATGSNTSQPVLLYSKGASEVQVVGSGVGGSGYGNLLVDYPNAGSAGGCITIRNSASGVGAFSSLIFEVDGSTSTTQTSVAPASFTQGNGMLYCQNVGPSSAAKMGFIQWNGGAEVETMTILPTGYVGIGRTSPAYRLDVYSAGEVARFYSTGTNCYVYLDNDNAAAYQTAIQFNAGGVMKWINYVPGNSTDLRWYNLGGDRMTLTYGGALTCSGDVTAYSDIRYKTNLKKIQNALDKVSSLNGYTFNRTDDEDKEKRHAGVVAQEVLEVLPEVVHTNDAGVYSVAYGNLAALLIEAVKEERQKREAVTCELRSLEERLARLEKLLEQK